MSKQASRNREWTDEYTLLCEKCGYVIEGLDITGRCPECGKPIAESLPERRIGTPWQQDPGFISLIQTWWLTLRHPKQTLDFLSPAPPKWLSLITLGCAGLLVSFGWMSFLLFPDPNAEEFGSPSTLSMLLPTGIFALIAFVIFYLLTQIETFGLRIFGSRSGFRISKDLSKSITAHAAVGWLLLAVCFAFKMLLGNTLFYVMTPDLQPATDADTVNQYAMLFNDPPNWVFTVNRLLYILILPGFLFFECFAYLGLRRCKFANRMKPEGIVDE